jgi:hypothetical protein
MSSLGFPTPTPSELAKLKQLLFKLNGVTLTNAEVAEAARLIIAVHVGRHLFSSANTE